MPNARGRGSSRDKLLDAASELISQHGVHELTLDAVAASAGVTKGGLIYHFKTKDELLAALLEQMIEQLHQRSHARAAQGGDTPGALLLALVDETFDMPASDKRLLTNFLAAASSYPHLMGPAQALFESQYRDMGGAGPKAGLALGIAAALDGVSLLELLNLHHFTQRQRDAMRRALVQLIKQLD